MVSHKSLTDSSTFTSPVLTLADKQEVTEAAIEACFQALANRTRYLYDNLGATGPSLATNQVYGRASTGIAEGKTASDFSFALLALSDAISRGDALHTKGSDIASAATTNIAGATGAFVHITGATTITAFGTAAAGVVRRLRFAGALTLTHNATSLILPGGANIVTAADDTAVAVSEGSGNWRVLSYQRASGGPVVAGSYLGLSDTDSAYPAGGAQRLVGINATEDGLEFKTKSKLSPDDPLWLEPEVVAGSTTDSGGVALLTGVSFDPSAVPPRGSVALGNGIAPNATAMNGNVMLGDDVGNSVTTETNLFLVGPGSDIPSPGITSFMNIWSAIFASLGSTKRVRVGGSGDLLTQSSRMRVVESGASTVPVLELVTQGTNGATSYEYVGTVVPTFSAPAGSLYTRVGTGSNAGRYQNTSASSPGTTWTQFAAATASLPTGYISTQFERANGSSVKIKAGSCRSDDDTTDIVWGSDLTAAITSSGANGLDAGTEANSTWYSVWVIYNGSSAAALLSASPTSPTLPGGYTTKRFIGWARNDSGGDFLPFICVGVGNQRKYHLGYTRATRQVLSGGSTTGVAAVDISAFVPDVTGRRTAMLDIDHSGGTQLQIGGEGPPFSNLTAVAASGSNVRTRIVEIPYSDPTTHVTYKFAAAGGSADIYVAGWSEEI